MFHPSSSFGGNPVTCITPAETAPHHTAIIGRPTSRLGRRIFEFPRAGRAITAAPGSLPDSAGTLKMI
jgi:hypothetical protein